MYFTYIFAVFLHEQTLSEQQDSVMASKYKHPMNILKAEVQHGNMNFLFQELVLSDFFCVKQDSIFTYKNINPSHPVNFRKLYLSPGSGRKGLKSCLLPGTCGVILIAESFSL